MGGFKLHELLPKLKVRVTAIHQHGDRLYVGCATGALQVFSFELPNESTSSPVPVLKHIKTHILGKRPIDQIGVLSESSQLMILSDTVVSLYALPDIGKPTLLSAARNAHAFAISAFQYEAPRSKKAKSGAESSEVGEKKKRDLVVIGCRKKVVVYGAGKSLTDPWEFTLPHSPRAVIFPSAPSPTSPLPSLVHLLYSPTSSVILHINLTSSQRLSVTELGNAPLPPINGRQVDIPQALAGGSGDSVGGSGLGMGMGAFSGLGGYVGLGSKAAVPVGTRTVGGEVVIARDDVGAFYSAEGNFTRSESIQWASPPEALVSTNPFLYAIVPVLPAAGSTGSTPVPTIQVHLTPTLTPRDSLALPAPSVGTLTVASLTSLAMPSATRSAATSSAARVLLVSTPTDKTLANSEGSTVWAVQAGDVGEQIDDLVRNGQLVDAIGLAESVGDTSLSPTRRLPHLKTLLAVQDFAKGHFQAAIETFLVFNVNPALVISLYPSNTISGKLHAPRDQWMELFGAVEGARLEAEGMTGNGPEQSGRSLLRKVAGLGVGVGKKASMDTLRTGPDAETASIASNEKVSPAAAVIDETVIPRPALEALMYFLSDRRQKLTGAITTATTPLPAEDSLPPLSSLPADTLHQLPSVPMSEYQPEELLRMAQVIYTALIKVYLVARPVLVGSLCRIENWCDVEEVEELLKEKQFSDLIDLYQGKKMHDKALAMLHDLAKEEDDKLDRYPPTVRYLQKLGPGFLDLILENSKWVLAEDSTVGLQIFTADEPEVEALPTDRIVAFLEKQSPPAYLGYLEHLITERKSEASDDHDRLAEVYLNEAKAAPLKGSKADGRPEEYSRLLEFLTTSTHYRPHKLLGKLKGQQMPEARAILLGRLGKHEEALRIYVFTLKDFTAAEMYCSRAYLRDPDPKGIFLLLLRIYLHPPTKAEPVLLEPALSLISTHGTRLDAKEVLDLLPPLVTMGDVRAFFMKTIRGATAKKNDSRIVRGLVSSRKEEVERTLMSLQVKRVRVTDQRIVRNALARLPSPCIHHGEVTHLHCKDTFSSQLQQMRG